ncbi:cytosolic sulfotransferase 15-like [Telopea speciosissima]|uniref:cytosolic sulfotransferase 15-like n=1 Tax=Telopea speciosissima TaxID=54955 RepID=UPI001CC5167D|nr:cytosolic sulfotransferase 15-like [Telopea speciosissima]
MANTQINQSLDDDSPMEKIENESQGLLLSSLPIEKGWTGLPLYQYQGFWCHAKGIQAAISFRKHFHALDSDIILVTTPKSGTTWLKALTFAILNRRRYIFSQNPLLTDNPHDLVPFFEFKLYTDNQLPNLADLPSPRLFATHIPYPWLPDSIKNSNCKIVHLCRNPRDTFVSYWHFTNKARPEFLGPLSLEKGFEMFSKGITGFGPFWDHALGYWNENLERPQKVLFLKYEELKEDITYQLKRLAKFMGCPFSIEEERDGVIDEISRLCSFDCLRNLDVNKSSAKSISYFENQTLFRKGEVGDWVNYLTTPMVERLDQLMEEKLGGSGLTFEVYPQLRK